MVVPATNFEKDPPKKIVPNGWKGQKSKLIYNANPICNLFKKLCAWGEDKVKVEFSLRDF